ncbi:ABC transporter, ATP-binding protein [Pseudoramibacter alactolyticus ATCC 23263]|uniref:Energy-coupling factor transporter ATP-binding protein EcfA2 n=1 Tax=Pseudoramibacter alactolyticus ATCC 23263 TaxID=887929 RepID=E6MHJ4_9FIRM|nr:energy-coupling factor transporter ATPase [Pseudoramibacter alactolyticus]EFV01425.1 ABC transporter, ATP-binding protein [Pseudoramibacter alactolyticus ATCC 23263]
MSVKIEHLEHIYAQGSPFAFKALDDVTVTLDSGAFIALIGHTGSGKSTLIQHLNGLLTPTAGTVYLGDKDVFAQNKKDLIALRHSVGLVFQYPEHQLFEETVAKDVAFGPKNLKIPEDEIPRRVRGAIEMVGLDYDAVAEKSPFELSGGQMRRVAIAGVLAMQPEVLILDEPTAGLDPRGRDEILDQIARLHDETHNTVILVSHSMEDVGRYADKILVMHRGKAVYYDTPAAVFKHVEALERIGLAVPQVKYLMRALKQKYPEIDEDIFTVAAARAEIGRVLGGERHV